MTRDIEDRLRLFVGEPVEVRRLALNRDQIDQYKPPPNPAKITDSRAAAYIAEHGNKSWELDALDPAALSDLIETAVAELRDDDAWRARAAVEANGREALKRAAQQWDLLQGLVKTEPGDTGQPVCPGCGCHFLRGRSDSKFCSAACRQAAYRKRKARHVTAKRNRQRPAHKKRKARRVTAKRNRQRPEPNPDPRTPNPEP